MDQPFLARVAILLCYSPMATLETLTSGYSSLGAARVDVIEL